MLIHSIIPYALGKAGSEQFAHNDMMYFGLGMQRLSLHLRTQVPVSIYLSGAGIIWPMHR